VTHDPQLILNLLVNAMTETEVYTILQAKIPAENLCRNTIPTFNTHNKEYNKIIFR